MASRATRSSATNRASGQGTGANSITWFPSPSGGRIPSRSLRSRHWRSNASQGGILGLPLHAFERRPRWHADVVDLPVEVIFLYAGCRTAQRTAPQISGVRTVAVAGRDESCGPAWAAYHFVPRRCGEPGVSDDGTGVLGPRLSLARSVRGRDLRWQGVPNPDPWPYGRGSLGGRGSADGAFRLGSSCC